MTNQPQPVPTANRKNNQRTTKEQLAAMITGREIGNETTPEIRQIAHDNKLIIIYGASDDLLEFEGAITDECNIYGEGEVMINLNTGELMDNEPNCGQDCVCKYYSAWLNQQPRITIGATYGKADAVLWEISANRPYATFDILEDGELFCRGIVLENILYADGNAESPAW